jgi:hypothetical protein
MAVTYRAETNEAVTYRHSDKPPQLWSFRMSYGTNAPKGLQPVRKLDGSAWTSSLNSYQIESTYATALFTGDPVTVGADGYLAVGVAGSAIVGVFQGVKYIDSSGTAKFQAYWPGNPGVQTGSTVEAMVIDDPNVVFTIQETNASGAAGTPLALADRGLNANFLYTAGSTAIGQSAVSLNNESEADTSTLNLKIIGLDPTPGNAVGAFANWLVTVNNSLYKAGVTGI